MLKELRYRLGTFWCIHNHQSVMWPVHGRYQCRTCRRRYAAFAEAPLGNSTERSGWDDCGAGSVRTAKSADAAIVCDAPVRLWLAVS